MADERLKFEEQRAQLQEYSMKLNELGRTINGRSAELAELREQVQRDQANAAAAVV